MEKIDINITITYCQPNELTAEDQELVERAKQATLNSYSPYSKFAVGAAVRLKNGDIIIGANQENAAFPSGLCAERTAIFAAQAQHPDQPITTLAIAARNSNGLMQEPVVPCGSCRQVMTEIEDRYNQPIRILLYGTNGIYAVNTVKDILPLGFIGKSME